MYKVFMHPKEELSMLFPWKPASQLKDHRVRFGPQHHRFKPTMTKRGNNANLKWLTITMTTPAAASTSELWIAMDV